MNHGEIVAREAGSGHPVRIAWKDGRITAVDQISAEPPRDLWIAPLLLDLQVNGYAGIDFQQDGLTAEQLLHAARRLRADGCGRFLLTLVTDAWPKMLERLRHARQRRAQSPELQTAIAGWHIEGPFLSAEPGYCGAHDPACMFDPSPERIHELREASGDDLLLLTLAPERLNTIEAIALAVSLRIKVSLGHTNAPKKRIEQAVRAGATAFTHLGNGIPRQLDRHDNILWRMFEAPPLCVSLIPDGIHVSPALFRLIHRELKPDAIFYVSDAMAAAGAPPGRYRMGHLELEVGEDEIVRLPGTPNFAGSALRPIEGVFRAAEMLHGRWQDAWRRGAQTPAALLGLPHELTVGAPADFCVLEVTGDGRLASHRIVWQGEFCAEAEGG